MNSMPVSWSLDWMNEWKILWPRKKDARLIVFRWFISKILLFIRLPILTIFRGLSWILSTIGPIGSSALSILPVRGCLVECLDLHWYGPIPSFTIFKILSYSYPLHLHWVSFSSKSFRTAFPGCPFWAAWLHWQSCPCVPRACIWP